MVTMVSDEMVRAFKEQGRALPPWRTRQAMMSKWSPTELDKLGAALAGMAGTTQQPQQQQQPAPALPPHMLHYMPSSQPRSSSSAPHERSSSARAGLGAATGVLAQQQQQQQQNQQWGFSSNPAADAPLQLPMPVNLMVRSSTAAEAPAGPESDTSGSPCSISSLSSADFAPQPLASGQEQQPASASAPRGKKVKSMLAVALKNASNSQAAAAAAPSASARSSSTASSSRTDTSEPRKSSNFIRTLEEPWARITTVRWGAYAAQATKPAMHAIS
jgi:hypothetical protein